MFWSAYTIHPPMKVITYQLKSSWKSSWTNGRYRCAWITLEWNRDGAALIFCCEVYTGWNGSIVCERDISKTAVVFYHGCVYIDWWLSRSFTFRIILVPVFWTWKYVKFYYWERFLPDTTLWKINRILYSLCLSVSRALSLSLSLSLSVSVSLSLFSSLPPLFNHSLTFPLTLSLTFTVDFY